MKSLLYLAILLIGLRPALVAQKPGPDTDTAAVADTLKAMYAAAQKDDLAGFQALIAPGFYAFDGGVRYEGDALMKMTQQYHAKGVTFVWTVNSPDVHVSGDTAWIAYTNVGSIQMGAAQPVTPVTWLESACLERRNGRWKLAFFSSQRAKVANQ